MNMLYLGNFNINYISYSENREDCGYVCKTSLIASTSS